MGLHKYCCDVAFFVSNLEEVNHNIALSLWDRRPLEWLFLPSFGRSRGMIVISDSQALELMDSKVQVFTTCCKLRSMQDNFGWCLIGTYRPSDILYRWISRMN